MLSYNTKVLQAETIQIADGDKYYIKYTAADSWQEVVLSLGIEHGANN
jgi:hypothetical protein